MDGGNNLLLILNCLVCTGESRGPPGVPVLQSYSQHHHCEHHQSTQPQSHGHWWHFWYLLCVLVFLQRYCPQIINFRCFFLFALHDTQAATLTLLFSDPYVKVWLMHKDKRVEKKKTVVMKCCLNPVFNESFPFDVPAHVLRETTIIITVMDKDRLSRNDVIGKVSPSLSPTPLPAFSPLPMWFCDSGSVRNMKRSLLTPAGTHRSTSCTMN